jgi:hypothetical protein
LRSKRSSTAPGPPALRVAHAPIRALKGANVDRATRGGLLAGIAGLGAIGVEAWSSRPIDAAAARRPGRALRFTEVTPLHGVEDDVALKGADLALAGEF